MNFRRGINRANRSWRTVSHCCTDSTETSNNDETASKTLTTDQRREWQRWIVETFIHASYGVVPVDHLVDELLEREPDSIDRSTVRTGLTETILPQLDQEGVLSYDAEKELVVNYNN